MPRPSDRQPTSPAAPDRHLARIAGPPKTAGLVNWAEAFNQERLPANWICRPLIPGGGRSTVLYAAKGAGKSDLMFYVAARLATGQSVLGTPAGEPLRVLYIDHEMILDDVLDRAEAFGFDAGSGLDGSMKYYSLPDLPKLDSPEGARDLLGLVDYHRANLVVVDTVTRTVEGEENSANTILAVGDTITTPLKRAGISIVWVGHQGKNASKGQRGTSEHGGIDELVWQLNRPKAGPTVLRADKRRAEAWMLPELKLSRVKGVDGHVVWELAGGQSVLSPEVGGLVAVLERLGVPPDATVRASASALKEAGVGVRTAVLSDAVRWRKSRETSPETLSA